MKYLVLISTVLLLINGAQAENVSTVQTKKNFSKDFIQASENYSRKEYSKAYEIYKKAAEKGDVDSQFELAAMYHDGIGIQKDIQKAIHWYQAAAKNKHAQAQVELGILYLSGEEVAKDYEKAFMLFQQAADVGNDRGYYFLGRMYWNGYGIQKDLKLASKYYKKAAGMGHKSAQYALASMYESGDGVPQDLIKAYALYEQSADKVSWSSYKLVLAYLDGNDIDIAKGMNYLQKAVDKNDVLALAKMAKIKYHGLYNEKIDKEKALEYFELATKEYEDVFFHDNDLHQAKLLVAHH